MNTVPAKRIIMLIGLSALLVPSVRSADDSIDIRLTYGSQPASFRSSDSNREVVLQSKLPPGEWKLPEIQDREPLFAMLKIGDTERLLVVDCVPETNSIANDTKGSSGETIPQRHAFFNRAYFDRNGNGNLLDDPILDGVVREVDGNRCSTEWTASFPEVETTVSVQGHILPYRFSFTVCGKVHHHIITGGMVVPTDILVGHEGKMVKWSELVGLRSGQICLSSPFIYSGSFDFKGKQFNVILADVNVNGYFDDQPEDVICVAEAGDIDSATASRCARTIVLGAKPYQAKLNYSGPTLVLTPCSGTLGKVFLSAKPERMELKCDNDANGVVLLHPEQELLLPPGKYRIWNYRLGREDKDGKCWSLSANGTHDSPSWDVVADKKNEFIFGEVFETRTSIHLARSRAAGKDGAGITVGYMNATTIGSAQEEVSRIQCAKVRPEYPFQVTNYTTVAPFYRIVNAKDEMIAEGVFHFGCMDSLSATWSRDDSTKDEDYHVISGYANVPFVMKDGKQSLKKSEAVPTPDPIPVDRP